AEDDIKRFVAETANRNWQLRQRGVLWSLALGSDLKECVRSLSKLYTRALRSQPKIVGVAREDDEPDLLTACDRGFVLTETTAMGDGSDSPRKRLPPRFREIEMASADMWDRIVEGL